MIKWRGIPVLCMAFCGKLTSLKSFHIEYTWGGRIYLGRTRAELRYEAAACLVPGAYGLLRRRGLTRVERPASL